ncbi:MULTISPECIES: phosphate/phosphite/phosphonate ABC transporter substrate-binding protein [Pseudomonas]|uniref:phosphate/phosphite/phosphonate ABC transporter substrate-binding protein n=1 Tax=Pseudomonas nitroreducens TaxID=46680 RepID=UPI001E3F4A00|nr:MULTISPECIES: PhnD/SsuA/transferrin family substrate-binding protein [Pseudomonas]MCE4072338.1 PhnD/SsuA/transferrin family substrate-binding protein [Pseudomonas nitritireducens]MCE4081796.1 PhnD/SsuA/transferrin family substrate-binding protein [Pseudomonas nitroreducens]
MPLTLAELPMYTAPEVIRSASEAWIARTLDLLDVRREPWPGDDLHALFLAPQLLLTQTCGYPLMTALRGQVRLIGRPDFDLPYSTGGEHCSLLLVREDEPRKDLDALRGCRGAANNPDSNTGMNLLRHALAPWQDGGRYFGELHWSGSHRQSLAWLREGRVDLIAIDSVTFAYLALHSPEETTGVRLLQCSAPSPTLPYITGADETQARDIRDALNLALKQQPQVRAALHIRRVLPTTEADYEVLLDYGREAAGRGLATLHPGC